eukprot:1903401-Rhodomonas_salina.2
MSDSSSFSYVLTQSGSYSVAFTATRAGGLAATYYQDLSQLVPDSVSIPQGSFVWTEPEKVPYGATVPDIHSVRWEGALRPPTSGSFTFELEHVGGSVAALRIDGEVVVDSLNDAIPSTVKVELDSTKWIDVRVDAWKPEGLGTFRLLWSGPGFSTQALPPSVLFYSFMIDGSPFSVTVQPAVICASASVAAGQGLTIVTAGSITIFQVQTKDEFSNDLSVVSSAIIVDYAPVSRVARSVRAIDSYAGSGAWDILVLSVTVAGDYYTYVSLADQGSIAATYYILDQVAPTTVVASVVALNDTQPL